MKTSLYLISDKYQYSIKLALDDPSENIAICLLQDAVYFACKGSYEEDMLTAIKKGIQIYAVEKDVYLRGLEDRILSDIRIIKYSELIDLIFSYERIINL